MVVKFPHDVHLEQPELLQYVPAPHSVYVKEEVAATVSEYFPTGHV